MRTFKTVDEIRDHFRSIEFELENGTLVPTSREGEDERDLMLLAVTELAMKIVEKQREVRSHMASPGITGHNWTSLDELIDLVDLRTKIALLLGKFEGFRIGQVSVVAKMGNYSRYLN